MAFSPITLLFLLPSFPFFLLVSEAPFRREASPLCLRNHTCISV